MIERMKVTDGFRHRFFLVTDADNTRPRVIQTWDLFEPVLRANFERAALDAGQLYRFWLWDEAHGGLRELERRLVRAYADVTSWGIFTGAIKLGEIDVLTAPHAGKPIGSKRR